MKTWLSTLVLILSANALVAAQSALPASSNSSAVESGVAPESVLATQVNEVAASTTMTRKTKDKLISSAVRLAISSAIQGIKDPTRALNIAVQFTSAAAAAAPDFADTILAASASVPGIAGLDGALAALQAAVNAGVDGAGDDSGTTGPSGSRPAAPSAQFGGNTTAAGNSPAS